MPSDDLARSDPTQALAFVKTHGIVLESASGPAPSLVEAIVGAKIKGNWWSHPKAKEIFHITRAVRASPQVLVCRLVGGKVTFVHERVWPALVRAASHFRPNQVSQLMEEHTASGKHRSKDVPFPTWVPADVAKQAGKLSESTALEVLDSIIPGLAGAP